MTSRQNRVAGHGSARDGTRHWWAQRLTAIALLPLAIAFLPVFAGVAGGDLASARAVYAHPFHAIAAGLFLAAGLYHFVLGLQVVVEDYVHHPFWKTLLLVLNPLAATLLGVIGVFALARLALAGG